MGSPVDRVRFLGWERPGLLSACEHLVSLASGSREIDLSGVTVVVPGGRVGRNLRALLVERAASDHRPLSPPQIVTVGGIPDAVLRLPGPFAGAAAQRLAWAEALRSMPENLVKPLIPSPPRRDDLPSWLAMGDMLASCHRELAAGMVLFAEVPARCDAGVGFLETERWQAAALVQERYRLILKAHGLLDADLERIAALRESMPGVMTAEAPQLVIVGVSELSVVARAALLFAGDRVTCLVFADAAMRERFDEFGCPREEAWASASSDLRDEQIVFADSPSDQADRVMESIAGLGGALSADQIAIGIADDDLVGFLERKSEIVGTEVRYAGGTPVRRTGVWRLLAALADYLERQDLASLRALVRHPDVEHRLRTDLAGESDGAEGTEDWLVALDGYAADSLHGKLTGTWYTEDQDVVGVLDHVHGAVERMVAPLRTETDGHPPSARAWAEPMLGVLEHVYLGRTAGASDGDGGVGRMLLGACRAVRNAIEDVRELADGTADWPEMTAWQALRFVMQQSAEDAVPDEVRPSAIEMLGWLELPLDPSEAVVVVGMNQGKIPASFRGDPFLSERLRENLGITSARQRFARDAYVLTSLVRSRREVTFIAGRRAANGEAIWPSRLLMACGESQLAPRIRRFLGKVPDPIPRIKVQPHVRPGAASGFPVAPITHTPTVESIRVTAFRTYLSSPYLFYLQNVLKLEESGDPDGELDPMSFGNLLHLVIEKFGRSNAKHSTSENRIGECLRDELSTIARQQFGAHPHAAVALQLEIARRRLESFAKWQTLRIRSDWLIDQAPEWQPAAGKGVLIVDRKPMGLRGRIDRIEKHAKTGQLAILDFKTGDKARAPGVVHRGPDGWKDLQLPLYRHLARELGACDDSVLGYVAIPSASDGVELLAAEWTVDDLAEADATAAEVVRSVRAGKFEDVGDGAEQGTVFAALCGTDMLGVDEDDADGEDADA